MNEDATHQLKARRCHGRFLPLTTGMVLALITVACAIFGSEPAGRVVIQSRLPTLTRTPLPTLTPTALTTPVTVALATEAPVATPLDVRPPDVTSPEPVARSVESPALTPLLATNSPPSSPGVSTAVINAPEAGLVSLNNSTANTPSAPNSVEPSPATLVASLPTATATAAPPTATAPPTPTTTPPPTPTETPLPEGWLFRDMRLYPDQDEDGLLLHGNALNHTSTAQELIAITGTFYDAQDQVIAGAEQTYAFWPGYVVPPGGSMPFEMIVEGIRDAARFDLTAEAEPSHDLPRQDFDVSEINQWQEDDLYCLEGQLRNPGGKLEDYLIIVAILYDSQDQVVNFGDYEVFARNDLVGDESSTFEICVEPPNQDVTRYEVVAWGR